jgi:hypothetical protein
MATQQRIYLVGTPDGKTRLIKAALRQQALSHVANTLLSVRVASQDDLVAEISKGTTVEQYNAPEQRDLVEETQAEAN